MSKKLELNEKQEKEIEWSEDKKGMKGLIEPRRNS
jgi:hypothetical protein